VLKGRKKEVDPDTASVRSKHLLDILRNHGHCPSEREVGDLRQAVVYVDGQKKRKAI
jgi:hypothetical protein